MEDNIYNGLCGIIGEENVLRDEPMSKHTTFRIGGTVDYFLTPRTNENVCNIIKFCKEIKIDYYIVGNGSNLLVSDDGIRGVVIQLYDKFNKCEIKENEVCAQSGILLSRLANQAAKNSLSGLEFASGIPGTLGGAVTMNAGAYGGEMKHVITEVTVVDENGDIKTLSEDEMNFGYRQSTVMEKEYVVLEAKMKLNRLPECQIREKMNELKVQRTSKQPLEYPSAGSTFKRPEGYYAGKLIMDSGLRGFSVGGAQVSEKHCGFVINKSGASAKDVMELIQHVQKTVFDKFNVKLETEVKMLGKM